MNCLKVVCLFYSRNWTAVTPNSVLQLKVAFLLSFLSDCLP